MRITRRLPFFVLVMLCLAPIVALAADCPALVKTALAAADKSCGDTGRNQACYGNIQLQATAKDGTQPLAFSKPGDKVDVGAIQSLKLSSMNQQTNQWGVALMKVQANIPDTLPGQNVTLLLFGNVELTPTGSNVNTLQAFTFKSAIGDSPCSQAPNGLLIQSPVGGQRVALTINGANFDIGSTVFISSEPGEGDNTAGTGMSISTLAGIVRITAQGKTVTSIQGTATGVALDDDLQAIEPPEDPAPLIADELAPLVETVQADTDLLTPLADDAAANSTIADLTAQGILAPITGDDPVNAIDPDKLTDATNKANEELNQAETPEQTETPDQPQTPDETNVPDQPNTSNPTDVPETNPTEPASSDDATSGKYAVTLAALPTSCTNPEILPTIASTDLNVNSDGSLSFNLGDNPYRLSFDTDSYLDYNIGPEGLLIISVDKITPQQLTGLYMLTLADKKTCIATLTFDLIE